MSQLDNNEAKRIFTLTKNPNALLNDKAAREEMRKFAKSRELGNDSKLKNTVEIYEKCSDLLLETELPLTLEVAADLLQLGIWPNEINALRQSLDGDRTQSNLIIKQIQEKCCNDIMTQDEFKEFTQFVLSKAN